MEVSHNLSASRQLKVSAEAVLRVFRRAGLRERAKVRRHCCQKGTKSWVSRLLNFTKIRTLITGKSLYGLKCGREWTWKSKNMKLRSHWRTS